MNATLERAVEAYGGETLWRNASHIEAVVDTHGLAFSLKRRPFYKSVKMQFDIQNPITRILPIGKKEDIAGVLKGTDVYLETSSGEKVDERNNARDAFSGFRRNLWWDDMDMAYFAGYAMWNYMALPALLLREDIKWRETMPGSLEAVFPDYLPTHCRVQQFHFDLKTGLLKQHDYTPDVISKIAKAANCVTEHAVNSDGITFTSKRLITPRSSKGKALPFPKLIEIEVLDFCIK